MSSARWVRFSVWSGNRGPNVHISPMIRGSGTVLRIMDTSPPCPVSWSTCRGSTRRWSGGVQAKRRPCGTNFWCELPACYGNWNVRYRRMRRWERLGVLKQDFPGIAAYGHPPEGGRGRIVRRWLRYIQTDATGARKVHGPQAMRSGSRATAGRLRFI